MTGGGTGGVDLLPAPTRPRKLISWVHTLSAAPVRRAPFLRSLEQKTLDANSNYSVHVSDQDDCVTGGFLAGVAIDGGYDSRSLGESLIISQ